MHKSLYTELSPQTFRVTAEQAALLDRAAKYVRCNKSDLIRTAALQMASEVLAATKW